MPLVKMVCSECGGSIESEPSKALFCPFCGTKYIHEQPIYQINNSYTTVNNVFDTSPQRRVSGVGIISDPYHGEKNYASYLRKQHDKGERDEYITKCKGLAGEIVEKIKIYAGSNKFKSTMFSGFYHHTGEYGEYGIFPCNPADVPLIFYPYTECYYVGFHADEIGNERQVLINSIGNGLLREGFIIDEVSLYDVYQLKSKQVKKSIFDSTMVYKKTNEKSWSIIPYIRMHW